MATMCRYDASSAVVRSFTIETIERECNEALTIERTSGQIETNAAASNDLAKLVRGHREGNDIVAEGIAESLEHGIEVAVRQRPKRHHPLRSRNEVICAT